MDSFTEMLLDMLADEAIKAGSDLIRDGVQLVKRRLGGDASDEEIMAWLRAAQEGDAE